MNKLRKPFKSTTPTPTSETLRNNLSQTDALSWTENPSTQMSRTLQLATASLNTRTASQSNGHQVTRKDPARVYVAARPQTIVEQYWAARALTAETALKTRIVHAQELKNLRSSTDNKHAREMSALVHASEVRQSKLEKFVVVLLGSVLLLFLAIVYILLRHAGQSPPRSSHFTIPILSPFASVVEHETGVIGAKTVTIFVLVLGALAYGIFRHWMTQTRR
ncbi:hypothetical protein BJ138DRAFT_1082811 [Hygrophoropsis aurantiaca]|uniref:Uncharacterized protein n=1 Tax=Hygrophoropsis aurantiaca TaxID=72124 RepID=A0ACB8AI38_9AGAM|nr:hypothetical protein BJ138DRAFT_1082811 [Hygrophoropsis aurantiaca]